MRADENCRTRDTRYIDTSNTTIKVEIAPVGTVGHFLHDHKDKMSTVEYDLYISYNMPGAVGAVLTVTGTMGSGTGELPAFRQSCTDDQTDDQIAKEPTGDSRAPLAKQDNWGWSDKIPVTLHESETNHLVLHSTEAVHIDQIHLVPRIIADTHFIAIEDGACLIVDDFIASDSKRSQIKKYACCTDDYENNGKYFLGSAQNIHGKFKNNCLKRGISVGPVVQGSGKMVAIKVRSNRS